MKITICGSMAFSDGMEQIACSLREKGHEVFLPEGTQDYIAIDTEVINKTEGAKKKIEKDLIRKHYELIRDSDAILVVNNDKRDIKNYIGGNSFLEIGFAYILGKKIYLLNDIPDTQLIQQEIVAMQPNILHGDLDRM